MRRFILVAYFLLLNHLFKCDYFEMAKDLDITSGASNLIYYSNEKSELYCMSKCHSKLNCLTLIFKKTPITKNCLLYNKHFNSTDVIFTINSNIYDRKTQLNPVTAATTTTTTATTTTTTTTTTTIAITTPMNYFTSSVTTVPIQQSKYKYFLKFLQH